MSVAFPLLPDQRIICVEGFTGIGKTLVYLLSAIPLAMAQNKPAIGGVQSALEFNGAVG